MVPDSAKEWFLAALGARSLDFNMLPPRQGISEMVDFFIQSRAEGCNAANGDTLLFQWGTYDWGRGSRFEVDITRQFIAADLEDDDAISQLHLTYRYIPSSAVTHCGAGNRWCKDVADAAAFSAYIAAHPALEAVAGLSPVEVALSYDYV